MVKDGIVLKNGKTQLALHQHSFCELVKYLLVGISYEEASQRVEQSPLAVPVTDAAVQDPGEQSAPMDGITDLPPLPCRRCGPRLGRQPHGEGAGGSGKPCPGREAV